MDSVNNDAVQDLSVLSSIECMTYYGIVVAELYNNMAGDDTSGCFWYLLFDIIILFLCFLY